MKRFSRLSLRWSLAALVLMLALPWAALADNVVNDVVVGGSDTFTLGGSTTVSYKIVGTGGDGQPGCNASDGSAATVTINTPAGVTATPGSLTFNACNVFKQVVFTASAAGDYTIDEVSVSDSGPGSYHTTPTAFTLHVLPPLNTAPTITVNDVTKEGNTAGGWTLVFSEIGSASDAEDDTPSVSCTPAIGSVLPLGEILVTCTATDSGGLTASDSGTVTVVDTTAPTLAGLPGDMTVEGNTTGGANVSYTAPTATDIVDAAPTVSCSPASGSFFALGGPTSVTCTATDASGNSASGSFNVTVVDTTPPNITCPADFSGTVGQAVSLGSPTVSDIVDASPSVSNNAPVSLPPGITTVTWTVTDASGNSAHCGQKVTLIYNWNGFSRPVDNLPTVNVAKAGSAIPVKFSLSGNQGLSIFAAGYPKAQTISCDLTATTDGIEETVTAGGSSLSYDSVADQYVYVWKTDKSWTGCRQLVVKLNDGMEYRANFKFSK